MMTAAWYWTPLALVLGYALGVLRSQRLLINIIETTLDLRDSRRPPSSNGNTSEGEDDTPITRRRR